MKNYKLINHSDANEIEFIEGARSSEEAAFRALEMLGYGITAEGAENTHSGISQAEINEAIKDLEALARNGWKDDDVEAYKKIRTAGANIYGLSQKTENVEERKALDKIGHAIVIFLVSSKMQNLDSAKQHLSLLLNSIKRFGLKTAAELLESL